jgi:signal peptidase II
MTAVAVLDQAAKMAVTAYRDELAGHVVIIPHFFHLVYVRNTGAAWGMLRGHGQVLAVLSMLVFVFIMWKFPVLVEGMPERGLALGMVLGGIIGNLFDRVVRGEVIDFLHFFYGRFEWPAFNVADSAICVGVVTYVLSSLLHPRRGEAHTTA